MAQLVRAPFGDLPDGRTVEALTLSSGRISVTVLTLGATIHAITTPDRAGAVAPIVLGYATPSEYAAGNAYFGATVGRFANRIAGGRFTLDGHVYQLSCNDGPNSLHGGAVGFSKRMWDVVQADDRAFTLRMVSPAGDQGYPGTLTVEAAFALAGDVLRLDYSATTDAPTIVNLSNHTYWNLGGEGSGSAMEHALTLDADAFTPVDATQIPTGEIRAVAGSVFDFTNAAPVGARIRDGAAAQLGPGKGYDLNWVVGGEGSRRVARVAHPPSGRVLEIWSDQPGVQFYSGNSLDGNIIGTRGRRYRQGDALVLEPQRFPDTPNQPAFGSARLDPGETYRSRIDYRFSVED